MKTYEWAVKGMLKKSLNAAPVPILLLGEIDSEKLELRKILEAITHRVAKEFKSVPYLDCIGITICPKEDAGEVVTP